MFVANETQEQSKTRNKQPKIYNRTMTPKQREFVKYLAKGLPQGKAARKAGFSESTADSMASVLVKKPHIRDALKKIDSKAIEEATLSKSFVLDSIVQTTQRALEDDDRQSVFKGCELLGKHLRLWNDSVIDAGSLLQGLVSINLVAAQQGNQAIQVQPAAPAIEQQDVIDVQSDNVTT